MSFETRVIAGTAENRTADVYELADRAGTVRAEVWPDRGFNCLRWQIRQADGRWADILFCSPDWEVNPVPTRSGHPVLFPFPGRLRDGQFSFGNRTFQLPLNDSTKTHAIHGFTPRNPWAIDDDEGGEHSARVTGAFRSGVQYADAANQWPSDFDLLVTYTLAADRLRVDARILNPDSEPLPVGLGYHPYFRLPGVHDADIGGYVLKANVERVWETIDNLPTGATTELPAELDFRAGKPIGSTALDHVFTGVRGAPDRHGLVELATLSHPKAMGRLRVLADPSFRNLVLFTPPHRHAVAIEPYSCSADAANLSARGIDTGWRVLAPREEWNARVEYRWEPQEL